MSSTASAIYQPETCGRCNGTALDRFKDRDGMYLRCGGCGGQGSVLVVQPSRHCASCKGTGEDHSRGDSPPICMACWGTTWAHRADSTLPVLHPSKLTDSFASSLPEEVLSLQRS